MCVCMLVCLCVCCIFRYLWKPEESFVSHEAGVVGSYGCWEPILGPLHEQQIFLITEPLLQSLVKIYHK